MGLRLSPNLIKAFAMVKLAAARANFDCGQFGYTVPYAIGNILLTAWGPVVVMLTH